MIYLSIALFAEAKPIIQSLGLKKLANDGKFQLFQDRRKRWLLVVGGVGTLNAAISVTAMMHTFPPRRGDLFVNIGVCGAFPTSDWQIGDTAICHKLLDAASGRTFFPDILIAHPFRESTVLTVARPLHFNAQYPYQSLVDMEASGCYAAAACHLSPHRQIYLKIVSDYLDPSAIDANKVSGLLDQQWPRIENWLLKVADAWIDEPLLTTEEEQLHVELCQALRLTVTLRHQLRQSLLAYKIRAGQSPLDLNLLQEANRLSTEPLTKEEGKRRFATICDRLAT